jgi:NADPH2:quinone reductase
MQDAKSHPVTMKAVGLEKPGGPLVIRERVIQDPGPDEVLIKIAAAPVNPSDIAIIKKAAENHDLTTFIPGLEGSGTVVAAGKGLLPHLWLGKRVACSSAYSTSGTWAEYMLTTAGMCFPLSKKVSDEQGSMSLVNPLTALAFFEIVKRDKHKAIISNAAASALGRMIELLGKKNGIPVINIVRNQKQVDMLKGLNSKHVLDCSDSSFLEKLADLAKNLNSTILFDPVCSSQLRSIIEALPHNSHVVIYGNLTGEEEIMVNPMSLIYANVKISGFYLGYQAKQNGLIKNSLNIMRVSQLMSHDLTIKIQGRFPITRAQEALDTYLGNMTAGKVILIPS